MDVGGSEQKVTRGKCRRIFGAHYILAANLKIGETRTERSDALVTKNGAPTRAPFFCPDPYTSRTCDLLLRRETLYPSELMDHFLHCRKK